MLVLSNKLMSRFIPLLCILLACMGLALPACEKQAETSVVARVNGEPITMRELQARHDLDHMAGSDRNILPAEELQSQYGDSLASLIVNTLVMQELKDKGNEVTSEEMNLAEKEIRSDYAKGEFEATLEDDAIDIEIWRRFLLQRLSVQKIMQTVLRPSLKVTPEESAAYYNANLDQFRLPARVHFLVVESSEKKALEDLSRLYEKKPGNMAQLLSGRTDVSMREVRMGEDRLSPEWRETLKKLEPGKASSIYSGDDKHEFIVLISRQEAAELPLAQAYPLIERELVEQKLELAFEAWVEGKIAESDIQIAEPLAGVWIKRRLNAAVNATSPGEASWLQPEEDYDPNADPFEDEEARELFKQESNP